MREKTKTPGFNEQDHPGLGMIGWMVDKIIDRRFKEDLFCDKNQ